MAGKSDRKEFMSRKRSVLGMVWCLCVLTGCQGYSNSWLHRQDVSTVYVEMFDTDGFRRGYEFTLTDAICKRIEAAEMEVIRIFYGLGFAGKEHLALAEKLLADPPKERFDRVIIDKMVEVMNRVRIEGQVMKRNFCHVVAPSTAAAS